MIQVKLQVCILQFILKKNMLVELCVSNYATFDGFVNAIDGIFKASNNILWKKPLYGQCFKILKLEYS